MNPFVVDPTIFAQVMPKRSTRRKITTCTLTFCALIIGYIVVWGDPDNGLHMTALTSSFTLAGTIAIGYALSAVADNAVVYTRPASVEKKEGA